MFIIVAIIYSSYSVLADESNNCDCDILQIYSPDALFDYQNFTKQNATHNGKPIYFSTQKYMISWNNHRWYYEKYNAYSKQFEWRENYVTKSFSFENMCKNKTVLIIRNDGELIKKM